MNVSIIGTGYVGLTTGVMLAALGHVVTCVDIDESKLELLRQGHSPIFEPHLESLLNHVLSQMRFTSSYAAAIPQADVVFIAVGTPSLPDGNSDLKYLRAAATSIGEHLGTGFTVVVNKSTVPIGSGNWVESLIRDAVEENGDRIGDRICVASNPEFLKEGTALEDSFYPDRIVIGADNNQGLEILTRLYNPILEQSFTPPEGLPRPKNLPSVALVKTDLTSAELIKYAANAFLSTKISFINEIAELAEKVGADVRSIAEGIGLDARIGRRFLQAGIGWGGSCFGKDTAAIISTAREYGIGMEIIQAAREVNFRQRARVIEKLMFELKILKGKTIGLLGLAFKPNTDDLRDAPALDIGRRLIERGARVRAHDPIAMDRFKLEYSNSGFQLTAVPETLFEDADAVVLVTEWDQYRGLCWNDVIPRMKNPYILDGRNFLNRPLLLEAGAKYEGIGF
jgi:UDPglucose 6-dehydrogenase